MMKKKHKLVIEQDYDFNVLAINSHIKAYRLCWLINQKTKFDFIKTQDHWLNKDEFFLKYKHLKRGFVVTCYLTLQKKATLFQPKKRKFFFSC